MNVYRWLAIVVCWGSCLGAARAAEDSSSLRTIFADPPREFASAPLWVWNDMLTEEQVVSSLRDLAGQKVRQAFVHPRPGLMTPYLSDRWFHLWKVALDEAKLLGMNLWIYDENSYPSGFAGGWVPELMPESRGRGLVLRESARPESGDGVLAVFRLEGERFERIGSDGAAPAGRYLAAVVVRAGNSPWHGDRCYVDLMYPGVTQKFLEVTLEPYRRHFGSEFGKAIPGSFTDEPNIRPAGGLPWTDDLPAVFQKRWGYSLLDNLPSLVRPLGSWKKVRHDYYQTLLDLFIERWGKPYYEYCERHGLAFTGHYWDHEWPNCLGVPDNMAMSAWQQTPGIDCLMNQYREDTHAQFGNVRMVKEVTSLCNQLGRKRHLCEIYGAGGWDLRFEDMKRIGDWLEVLGVNLLDEHLSYVTLRGARKADHPQSFSYHEPWWPDYHVIAQYFTRMSAVMSHGRQVNRILVLEPTTTAWLYQQDSSQAKRLGEIGKEFFDFLVALERAQVEYDLGCEDVIARHGRHKDAASETSLRLGEAAYDLVVLPPGTETLRSTTVQWLAPWIARGGKVISCVAAPNLVDARPSPEVERLAKSAGWTKAEAAVAVEELARASAAYGLKIQRAKHDQGALFHHRRQLADGEFLLLVNTSIESPSSGVIRSPRQGVEQWDLMKGSIRPYSFTGAKPGIEARFELPPCGSLLLWLSKSPTASASPATAKATAVPSAGPLQVRRIEPNVLTLDYLDVTAGGETKKNAYFYQAAQFAFRKNGMPRNPWDSAVQFRDELISRKFPADSGVRATYHFTLEGTLPKPLWIVVERPDLYRVNCNGKPMVHEQGQWWLDKAFGKIDISSAVREGANEVTLDARPMTIYHELQPAYLLGDFTLVPKDAGFSVTGARPLRAGPGWNEQGCPFYATGVAYRQTFSVAKRGNYRVTLGNWHGSVARVSVNGKPAGTIAHRPWSCDVSDLIQPGENAVEIVIVGTLKNTLGPHHNGSAVGSAWPGMFHRGPENGPPPGNQYHTIGYGLFTPPSLELLEGPGA